MGQNLTPPEPLALILTMEKTDCTVSLMKLSVSFHFGNGESQNMEEECVIQNPRCIRLIVQFPQLVVIWGCHDICWCQSTAEVSKSRPQGKVLAKLVRGLLTSHHLIPEY